jgi:hypothetical protein
LRQYDREREPRVYERQDVRNASEVANGDTDARHRVYTETHYYDQMGLDKTVFRVPDRVGFNTSAWYRRWSIAATANAALNLDTDFQTCPRLPVSR